MFGFPALVSIGASQVLQIVAAVSGTLGNLRFGSIDFGGRGDRDAASSLPASWWECAWRMPSMPRVLRKVVAILCLVVRTWLVVRELGGLH